MMKFIFFVLCFFLFGSIRQGCAKAAELPIQPGLVANIQKIAIKGCPEAHNPSLVDTDKGLLLTFRWLPDPLTPWISLIGVVWLDDHFNPCSEVSFLNTRVGINNIPSQSEDARIFYYQDDLYVVYNDNPAFMNPTTAQRRDIYVAKLSYEGNQFVLSEPVKLVHQQKYFQRKWQKNWSPFEWHGALLFSYTLIPHEVLYADLTTGDCFPVVETPFSNPAWKWKWGDLRGGTPALLVDGEYLAFFHSSVVMSSPASNGVEMYHYLMGAYTFELEPPFSIKAVTPSPIMAEGFYTPSSYEKRVVFPGGFIVKDRFCYVAYGKDDREIWIATISREKLKQTLVPVQSLESNEKKK